MTRPITARMIFFLLALFWYTAACNSQRLLSRSPKLLTTDLSELLGPGAHLHSRALNVALYAVDDFALLVHHSGQIL